MRFVENMDKTESQIGTFSRLSPKRANGQVKASVIGLLFALMAIPCGWSASACAQTGSAPGFWDPQRRAERPDVPMSRVLRFITEDDYPPFNFMTPDGALSGFNVELAGALCDELKMACTIQARRWDTLVATVAEGRADAAIASITATAETSAKLDFTAPYYKTPGRFVARRDANASSDIRPETLAGKAIGVEAGTAHEAFLRAAFATADIRPYPNQAALRAALKAGETPLIFGDGISLALWLNGADAASCCGFFGGPFLDSLYFGEGIGIGLRKGNSDLRRLLDYGLRRLYERGVYADLYLKFFPVGFF